MTRPTKAMSEHGTYCCETCRAEGWRCPAPCARPCCAATQPEQGTADVEALLLRVAEEHRLIPAYRGAESGRCHTCHAPELRDMLGSAAHRAHVASAQAAALAGMLPVTAPGSSNLQQTLEQAEAALAAERARVDRLIEYATAPPMVIRDGRDT